MPEGEPSLVFRPVVARGRCRLRARAGVEMPHCVKSGPLPRIGASLSATPSATSSSEHHLWVFGGLLQLENEDRHEEEEEEGEAGLPKAQRVLCNELWSFDTSSGLWSWHGADEGLVGTLPAPRWLHTCIVVRNHGAERQLIVFGGALDEGRYDWAPHISGEVYVFSIAEERWSTCQILGSPPPAGPITAAPFEVPHPM
jgi:hypothetical protein